MSKIVKIVQFLSWPVRKLGNYTKSINTFLEAPTAISNTYSKTFTYVSKVTGVTVGATGAAKGSVDAIEALACQDGVCFVVSCIGVGADALHMAASFVPGPNFTAVATVPISASCKVFVWCCKRSKIPWGSCK